MPAAVAGLEIELIAHATEDLDKVLAAAKNILPPGAGERVKFKVKEYKGHYGNPIRLLKARVRDRELARAIFEHIIARLPEGDREELLGGLKRRLSGGALYLRLDKQWASLGQIRLCAADPIWVRVRFSSSRAEDIRAACEGAGQGP